MDNTLIKALGFLLSTYESDLNYFAKFIEFSERKISFDLYVQKAEGTFKNFIDEFRVARNTKKVFTPALLETTLEWYRKAQTTDVDGFALAIKEGGLTHGKVATSLSSKVMFLMNPWEVIPLDRYAKAALKHRTNNYGEYIIRLQDFQRAYSTNIQEALNQVEGMLEVVESRFAGQLKNLGKIRENRLVDKWLWVKGRNK